MKGLGVIWSNKSERNVYRNEWERYRNLFLVFWQKKNRVMNNVLCWLLTDDYDYSNVYFFFLKNFLLNFLWAHQTFCNPPKMQFFSSSHRHHNILLHSDKKIVLNSTFFIRLPFIDVPVYHNVVFFVWTLERVLEWIQSRMFNKILTVTISIENVCSIRVK